MAAQRAAVDDSSALKATIAAAFDDDPVWRHCLKGTRNYRKRLESVVGFSARVQLAAGTVWTTSDRCAFAIWAAPGAPRDPPLGARVAFSPVGLWATGFRPTAGIKAIRTMESHHPAAPHHWYLAMLGTRPELQGRGLGSAVLQPVLRLCDEQAQGAYLESSKESNVPFYERHGFRVVSEVGFDRGGPNLWTMWRDPREPS